MHVRNRLTWFGLCYFVLAVSVLSSDLLGQSALPRTVKHSPVNVPGRPSILPTSATQAATHERFATFRAGEFKSVFLLQNFRSDVPVKVTPLLILSRGEVSLDPVTLQPHSATTVDINSFLQAHGFSDRRGTAVMRYTFSPYEAVSGVVLSSDEVHRLYVNSYAQSPEEYWEGSSYDATLWAPDEDTKGSISIINTSQEQRTVHVTFLVKGRSEEQAPIIVPARHTQTLDISDLVARSRETGAGIHIEYSEYPGTILVEGHLVNQRSGFEKYIHFLDKTLRYPTGAVRTQFLLLGQQPGEDGFPTGMSFRSVAVVHNIDSIPVRVTPTLKFQRNGLPQSISLEPLALGIGESRLIDLKEEQKAGLVPGDFHQGSLKLDPNTDHASIVAELFNFNDETGGFTIGPMFFAYPGRATQSIWRTDGTFQTTIMVENTAAQDDDVTVQLFSDSGTYTKSFPIPAGNLLKINLKQLQEENMPDDNGHSLVDTYGVLSIAGKNGHLSKLSFDKLIHSAIDSDYVGLPGGPGSCVSVQSVFLFLAGNQSPFAVWEEWDWTDGTVEDSPAGGTWSNNTSMMQIYSTSNGDMANTYPYGSQGGGVAFFGNPTPVMDCPACSEDDATPEGRANVPPMPTLSCSPATLTRAQTSTCTVTASGTATYSGWKFTDGTNTVSSTNSASSWAGAIVTSGTVSVNVSVQGSASVPLSASLSVSPRSGFAFTAVSPQQEPDPFSSNGCSISVPSPPTSSGDAVGMFCLAERFNLQTSPQIASGPNTGYSYVTSISNSNSNGSTAYYWTISPDLQNTTSTFYQAQCGNYSQTNLNGFISGLNLNTNTVRHESGTVESHYGNYVVAQGIPTNNVGTVAESIVGLTDPTTLANNASSTLSGKQDTITTATQGEPCDVTHNASCVFQGFINFFPYQSCN
jgi:hypothetical protein